MAERTSLFHHVRKEDLRAGSALEADPPFPSFDVVHRMDYERLQQALLDMDSYEKRQRIDQGRGLQAFIKEALRGN